MQSADEELPGVCVLLRPCHAGFHELDLFSELVIHILQRALASVPRHPAQLQASLAPARVLSHTPHPQRLPRIPQSFRQAGHSLSDPMRMSDPMHSALARSMISVITDSLAAVHAWHLQRRCSSSSCTHLSQYGHVPVGRSSRSCARTAVHRAPVRAPISSALSSSVSQWDRYASVRPLCVCVWGAQIIQLLYNPQRTAPKSYC